MNTLNASRTCFLLLAAFFIAMGVLYIVWPIAPYHEKIIGMDAVAFQQQFPEIAKLMVALVDVVGISFIAFGITLVSLGWYAATNKQALLTLAVLVPVYGIPLFYIVLMVGGPAMLTGVGLLLHMVGLAFAAAAMYGRKLRRYAELDRL